jgi:hypothetical protein
MTINEQQLWIAEQNIARFKARLMVADDILERKMLQGLIVLETLKRNSLVQDGDEYPIAVDGEPSFATNKLNPAATIGEYFLREVATQTPNALAMFDHEMRYLALSERWKSDYSLFDDVIGECHYDVFPEIVGQWREVHQRGLAGETVKARNDPFRRLDGSVQRLNWEVRPWFRSNEGVGGILIYTEMLP